MISEEILFVSLIPLLILFGLFVRSWRCGLLLRTIILGATLIHELLLVVFPVWHSVFTDFGLMFALAFIIGWPSPGRQRGRRQWLQS
jgi:hypothetical protein